VTAAQTRPRLFTPAFAALSAAVLVFFIAGGILLPVTPLYSRDILLADKFVIGLVIGAFAVSSLLMRPFAGRLTDRRGRRIALMLGAAISIAAMAGHLIAFDVPTLIFMRLALGAGEALFFVAGRRPRRISRPRTAAASRSAWSPCRCTSGSRSGRCSESGSRRATGSPQSGS
jgi:MFS family permease